MRCIRLLLTFLLLASAPAVSSQDSQDPQQHLKIQHAAKLHGVHSEKLSDIMRRMIATLMQQPAAADDEQQRAKHQARLVQLAAKVNETAKSINHYLPDGELSEAEVGTFRELALQLQDEALNTQTAMQAGDVEAMNGALDRFNQTCISCHRLFREM